MTMQYSDPKGRLGARSGVATQGWQYPINDPAAATRNKLREMGLLGNPFNKPYQRQVDMMSAGAFPQFLIQMLDGKMDPNDSQGMQGLFGKFLEGLASGMQKPMGYGEAMGGMDRLRSNLAGVSQKVAGQVSPGGDMKETINQMGLSGQLSPLEMAIAGMMIDPQDQMDMMHGALMLSLGPGLTAGLAKAQAPLKQRYDDYLGVTMGGDPSTAFTSMLDILMGKTSGAPGAPPTPPGPGSFGGLPIGKAGLSMGNTGGAPSGGGAPMGASPMSAPQSGGMGGGPLGGMSQGLTMGGGMDPMQAAMQTGTIPSGMTGALQWPIDMPPRGQPQQKSPLDALMQLITGWLGNR